MTLNVAVEYFCYNSWRCDDSSVFNKIILTKNM